MTDVSIAAVSRSRHSPCLKNADDLVSVRTSVGPRLRAARRRRHHPLTLAGAAVRTQRCGVRRASESAVRATRRGRDARVSVDASVHRGGAPRELCSGIEAQHVYADDAQRTGPHARTTNGPAWGRTPDMLSARDRTRTQRLPGSSVGEERTQPEACVFAASTASSLLAARACCSAGMKCTSVS
jgi:hypothetical protein